MVLWQRYLDVVQRDPQYSVDVLVQIFQLMAGYTNESRFRSARNLLWMLRCFPTRRSSQNNARRLPENLEIVRTWNDTLAARDRPVRNVYVQDFWYKNRSMTHILPNSRVQTYLDTHHSTLFPRTSVYTHDPALCKEKMQQVCRLHEFKKKQTSRL